jgi:predicted GNAT family N-acyltransferase
MTDFQVEIADWANDQDGLIAVRTEVFVNEQKVPADLELDDHDLEAIHLKALDQQGTIIATARMLPNQYIGRMCVQKSWRGLGVGLAMMRFFIGLARENGISSLHLNAQVSAIPFYRRLGFEVDSEVFMEADIPHQHMTLIMD